VSVLCRFHDSRGEPLKNYDGIDEIALNGFSGVALAVNSSELMMLCASVCCNIWYQFTDSIKRRRYGRNNLRFG
jgi:hypothetical protein